MKKTIYCTMLIVLVACNGNISNHHHHHESEEHHGFSKEIVIEPERAEILGIKTIRTSAEPFNAIIKASGKIESDKTDSWDVVTNFSGKISFLQKNIAIGTKVNRNEALFSISSDGMNNQNHKAELEKYSSDLKRAKANYEHIENLRKDRLATEQELLSARNEYEIAKINFDRITTVTNKIITACRSGYIQQINIENGQYIEEGSSVATISSGQNIIIAANVPIKFSSVINSIVSASFSVNGQFFSTEEMISSSDIISDGNTTIPVHFKMTKYPELPVGLPVELFLKLGKARNIISVPKSAISEKYGRYYVYIRLDEDCYKETEVQLGESDGIRVEITNGLEEGVDIVSDGVYYVKMAGANSTIPHGHSH